MANVRNGIILLGFAVLGLGFATSPITVNADELPPEPPAQGGPVLGGWGGPVDPQPAAPAAPAQPAPPAVQVQMGTNGLPKAVDAYCPDMVRDINYRLQTMLTEGVGFKGLRKPYKNPSFIKARYRQLKESLAEFSRVHLRRDYPVMVLDELIPFHAETAAQKAFGTLKTENPAPLDSATAIAHIDQLIQDTLNYPQERQKLVDSILQAKVRKQDLESVLNTPASQRPSQIALDVVKNGEASDIPLVESVSSTGKLRSLISKEKDGLETLDGGFGVEGSLANADQQQAFNIELLRTTRKIFDDELQKARINDRNAPIPQYFVDKYKDIARILDEDRSSKKIKEGFAPPREAFDKIKVVEMRKDIKDLFFTIWGNVNDRRIKLAVKNKYGEPSGPSPLKRIFGKDQRNSPSTDLSAVNAGAATDPSPASPAINLDTFSNFIDNMTADQRAGLRINKVTGYLAYARRGAVGAGIYTIGNLGLQYLSGGLSIKDLAVAGYNLAMSTEKRQKDICAANVQAFAYSSCRSDYLKSKFLKSYMNELGMRDDAVATHPFNKEIDISIPSIATKPTRGSVYKDPRTGFVYLRPEFSPRNFLPQPGATHDSKYPVLKIDPKSLPALGAGYPIELDTKNNKIVIHANSFVKNSGFLVYTREGTVVLAPSIQKEAKDIDDRHLLAVKQADNQANVDLLMQKNANLNDPCSDDSKALWLKSSETVYETKLAQCVDQAFNIFVSREPIAQTLNATVKADATQKRAMIDKLVAVNDNFGNCVCTMLQQREAALDPQTKVDYKCGTCVDPSTISVYGLGLATGSIPTIGAGSTWPLGNGQTIPWGGANMPNAGGWTPGGWPPGSTTTGTGTGTTPGTTTGPIVPGGVTPAVPGGYVVLAPVAGVPVNNGGTGNTTQTRPGSFSIPTLTGPAGNNSPPPFFIY